MITFKDLSEYDIKSIDWAKLRSKAFNRKDILANIGLVIVFLFISGRIVGDRNVKASELAKEVEDLEVKSKTVDALELSKKSKNDFFQSLPKGYGNLNDVVDRINELAINHNIQISSYAPSASTSFDQYATLSVRFDIVADTYEDTGFFAKDIENSKGNLRVDAWEATSQVPRRRTQRSIADLDEEKINVTLTVTSVNFIEMK
ncbi:MAG: hypothetical protein ABIJ41_00970 [Candidatus Omnitrophota bacterium]